MVIAWTGRGILVLVIWLVAALLAVVLGILLLPVGTDAIWIMALCFLLSALGTYVLARFGLSETPRPSVDPKTGATVMVPQEHTFNWIKAKYYPNLFAFAAIATALWALIKTTLLG